MRSKVIATTLGLMLGGMGFAGPNTIHIYCDDYPPHSVMSKDGKKVEGAGTALVKMLFKKAGIKDYTISLIQFSDAMEKAENNINSGINTTARTPKREGKFKWVGPIFRDQWYVYAPQNYSEKDLKKYDTGTVKGFYVATELKNAGYGVKEFGKPDELVKAFNAGEVTMIGYTYSTWPNFKAKLGPKADGLSELTAFPARYPYYIAFSKKTSDELINKLNAVLAKMRDKGIVAKIYKKHAKLDPGL